MWFIFALASAFFAAVNRTLIKSAGRTAGDSAIVFARSAFGAIPAVALLFVVPIPSIPPKFFVFIFCACSTDVIALLCMSRSLRLASMQRAVPLLSFTPVFLLVTGVLLLNESPSLQGLVGVVVTVTGSYLLSSKGTRMRIWEPFVLLIKEPGARYMLVAAACFSVAGPFFKKAVLSTSPYFTMSVSLPLSTFLLVSVHLLRGRHFSTLLPKKENLAVMIGLGLGVVGVALSTNFAFELGLISYVVSIKRLSILISLIMGAVIFHERNLKEHLIPATIMVAGACIIALS
ncbi:MAG: EamA family transporter [Lentisphaeria bacterium]